MRCLACNDELPLEERGKELKCKCGIVYKEVDDLGWWGYTAEIYVPVTNEDKND